MTHAHAVEGFDLKGTPLAKFALLFGVVVDLLHFLQVSKYCRRQV